MAKPQLDRSREPDGVVYGSSPAMYMQDGEYFDSEGKHVTWEEAASPVDPLADQRTAGEKAAIGYQEMQRKRAEQGAAQAQQANAQVVQTDNVETTRVTQVGKTRSDDDAPDISSLSEDEQKVVDEALANFHKTEEVSSQPLGSQEVTEEEQRFQALMEAPPPVILSQIRKIKEAFEGDPDLTEEQAKDLEAHPQKGEGSKKPNCQFIMRWAS